MKKFNVAILGATGAVGQTMLKVLEERNFPINNLVLLASKRSAGKIMYFKKQAITLMEADENSFDNIDIVLGAVENAIAIKLAPSILKAKAVFIDNSSAFRLDESTPLVVPEVNKEDILAHHGIIANPNCVTIIALCAIQSLHKEATIKRIIASTYQAVSGAGVSGINELSQQVEATLNHKPLAINTFAHQIAFNVIPQIGGFDAFGYTSEEMKLQNEGRKILHAPSLKINCTCVRIPVYTSHSIALTLEFDKPLDIERAINLLSNADGIKVIDNPSNIEYPMPINSSDQDLVNVGRIRQDLSCDNGISLWCCGDQLRKGAATNAVQIAEELIKTL